MADITTWIDALRSSHDRFTALVQPLDEQTVRRQSYDDDWTIADVASHLGSQAEIFELFLNAGVSGGDAPGQDVFRPIWERWNAAAPEQQVRDSVSANEKFVSRLESLDEAARRGFRLSLFGSEQDLAGLCTMRLGEHAVHTWDVAVAVDPRARIADDAVELLIDTVAGTAARAGKSETPGRTVVIAASSPERRFRLTTGPEISVVAADDGASPDLELPAEALVRLFYGRLDPGHTPASVNGSDLLDGLRSVFPGF